jgi:hypothetical protein
MMMMKVPLFSGVTFLEDETKLPYMNPFSFLILKQVSEGLKFKVVMTINFHYFFTSFVISTCVFYVLCQPCRKEV